MKDLDNENDSNLINKKSDSSDSIKKFVLEDSTNPFIDNLPLEASELMKSILSNDAFIVNKDDKKNKGNVIDSSIMNQVESSMPKLDKQTQDLLRRMILQESVVKSVQQNPVGSPEYPLPQINKPVQKEPVDKNISLAPPPPISKLGQTSPPKFVQNDNISKEKRGISLAPPPPPPKQQIIEIRNEPREVSVKNINKNKNKNSILVNENTGILFGIEIGTSKKKDVIEIMQEFSKVEIASFTQSIFSYDDIGVSFYFTESGILQEITLACPFEGQTLKGLKIEDSVERAVELYGHPKMRTGSGAIWPRLAIFLTDDIITAIRLKNS